MKSIFRYSKAAALFVIVFFSLLAMNVICFIMVLRPSEKKEEERINESCFFAGFEFCPTHS